MIDIKQVIVMRKDLKMRRGKEIAQGAHASMKWLVERVKSFDSGHSLAAYGPGFPLTVEEEMWLNGNFKKITVQVDSEKELLEVYDLVKETDLEVHLIVDSGLTEFNGVPTATCLAIGPDVADRIDRITGHLKLY